MFNRVEEWRKFSKLVDEHIENYACKQWGDFPDDQITNWTVESCLDQVKKYVNRYGKNARMGQEELDFFKAAHIIAVAYTKFKSGFEEVPQEEMVTITRREYEELSHAAESFHIIVAERYEANLDFSDCPR